MPSTSAITASLLKMAFPSHINSVTCTCENCKTIRLTQQTVQAGLGTGLYPAIPVQSRNKQVVRFFRELLNADRGDNDTEEANKADQIKRESAGHAAEKQGVSGAKKDTERIVKYDPDFAQPPKDKDFFLITSKDDVLFYVPRQLLVARSAMFADMPSTAKITSTPLLFDESALAVRGLLCILDATKPTQWIRDMILANSYDPNLSHLFAGMYRLVDLYGIVDFHTSMTLRLGLQTPFDLLALSMMSNKQEGASKLSRAIVLADLDPLSMPPSARVLLETFAPTYLIEIHTQYRFREKWWSDVELRFKVEEDMGSHDFGLNCKKKGCETYTANRKHWQQLRSKVADAALAALKGAGSDWELQGKLEAVIGSMVGCRVCAGRFKKAFVAAIKKEHERRWRWDMGMPTGKHVSYVDWSKHFSDQAD